MLVIQEMEFFFFSSLLIRVNFPAFCLFVYFEKMELSKTTPLGSCLSKDSAQQTTNSHQGQKSQGKSPFLKS